MNHFRQNKFVARLVLATLVLACTPFAAAVDDGARLEGYLLDVDGTAAVGHGVHLIDADGRDVAQAVTSEQGLYRFRDLAPGAYSLAIESPTGLLAPVAAPPVRIDADQLARRDVKLVQAGPDERDAIGLQNDSFGVFWAGLSPAAKTWAVIGTFVIIGITIKALDDEQDATRN